LPRDGVSMTSGRESGHTPGRSPRPDVQSLTAGSSRGRAAR
jgi:hypothetical protein